MRAVGPYRRVLAGFDGSPDAADALRAAAAIAARDGGHVVALSVLRNAAWSEDGHEHDSTSSALRDLAEGIFDEVRRDLPAGCAVQMTVQILHTDRESPAHVVTQYAAEHGFDVLVLGRHGDGRRRRSHLGQVADQAVRHCSVPVLLLSA